ncbi:MAG: peptidylprolyl isomerase [Candidatus Melainabacteria bacterium]|nr:peptidylprolyl isomerase [Candidatus Melainabacteria bacterium]
MHTPGSSNSTLTLNAPPALTKDPTVVDSAEGPVHQVNVTVGPFDIHRKYRSMEGPYVSETLRVSDMLASKQISVGESAVKFVESGNQPSMMGSNGSSETTSTIVHSTEPKQLIWAKGVKLIVLDENDKPLPTGEFICHYNVDVDPRNTVFPEVHTGSSRTKLDGPEMHGPACMVISSGENAPNATTGSIVTDANDRKMTGHWRVPPGIQPYMCPISEDRDYGFASEDRMVRAVWTHVHPLCKNVKLMVCDGAQKTPAWSVDISTKTDHGLEIAKIGDLYFKDGILLPKGKHFEIDSIYDNTTGKTQDSMVSQGIFFDDTKFVKPDWTHEPQVAANSTGSTAEDYNGSDRYSPFDAQNDGPLLTKPKMMEVTTSVGKLHMLFDPTIAPQHATQLYKLFKAGAFDDTNVIVYQPSYIFQIGSIDIKHNRQKPVTNEQTNMLRRLPLEVEAQKQGRGLNQKWALTMARSHAEDSAVSSFSILLDNAPHLDTKYTVFGRLIPDAMTVATMKKMMATWEKSHAYIVSAKDINGTNEKSPDMLAEASSQLEALSGKNKEACDDLYCGIKPTKAPLAVKKTVDETYPIYSRKTDGPLLTAPKTVEMKTSAGNIHIVLDPAAAPINASQMYKLFKAGAFDGTSIVRYEPNFVLQTALAQVKENGNGRLSPHVTSMLRRLPLEVEAQNSGKVLHKKFALSMAHGDDPNSAVTSFSILLGTAPHLDKKYTIFGHALNDPETVKTLEKIESEWTKKHPYILSISDDRTSIASTQH